MSKLLVPIYIDALVLTKNSPKLKKIGLDYKKLTKQYYDDYAALGGFLVPSPETLDPYIGESGVHLHWTLPEAFRHGIYDSKKGDLHFPLIPNRWLIHRIDGDGNAAAWILESDSPAPRDTNWADVQEATKQLTLKSIGKWSPLAGWVEPNPQDLFLTIMAAGNPDFAACYGHSKNVMGFYDPLTGVLAAVGKPALLSYQVFGWYSNASSDILAGVSDKDGFDQRMTALNWNLANGTPLETVPNAVLCHTSIHSVKWEGVDGKLNSNIPSPGNLEVAIGQSSSDALAALLKSKIAAESLGLPQQLLAALQYKKLEENGLQQNNGLQLLQRQIKDRGFYPLEGGSTWIIEPQDRTPQVAFEPKNIEKKPLPLPISDSLTTLLVTQTEFDTSYRLLISYQEALHGVCYKILLAGTSDVEVSEAIKTQMEQQADDLIQKIKDTSTRLAALKKAVPDAPEDSPFEAAYQGEISDLVKQIKTQLAQYEDFKNYVLKETKAPVFFRANDPTIVIDGLKPDERYLEQGILTCRLANEVVQNLRITFNERPYTVAGGDLKVNFQLTESKSPIPPEIESLVKESLLWNTSMSPRVAQRVADLAGTKPDEQLEARITQTMEQYSADDYDGTLPERCAANLWTQPWNPLYLEWGVTYEPAPEETGDRRSVYGRTLLSNSLVNRVSNINKQFTPLLFQTVRPMSQTLSGLSNQLIGRYNGTQLPLFNRDLSLKPWNDYIGNEYAWQPQPDETTFYPLRAGTITLNMLRVIDAFEQVLKIIGDGAAPPEIAASSAFGPKTPADQSGWPLPRRLPQPARLDFKWLSAEQPERFFNTDISTSPIHGWLLLDKLDNRIEVYEASGKDLGALARTSDGVRFVPAIDNPSADISDKSLNAFVQNIVHYPTNANAGEQHIFDKLYEEMGKLHQKVSGKASRQSFVMGLPIGYPIALATARCTLEVAGMPVQPLDWEQTIQFDWKKTFFKVQIGDYQSPLDGLLGYFVNGDFSRLSLASDVPEEKISIHKNTDLTLLIDPRMGIQIQPEVLPGDYQQLPAEVLKKTLEQMQVGFLAAPIITPAAGLQVPLMDAKEMTWQWMAKSAGRYADPAITTPGTTNLGKLTFEPIQAVEGWLKLVNKKADDA